MILFPYKKVVIKTEMSKEEFLKRLNEVNFESELISEEYSEVYFYGKIFQNNFELTAALINVNPKEKTSFHTENISGFIEENKIEIKIGSLLHAFLFRLFYIVIIILLFTLSKEFDNGNYLLVLAVITAIMLTTYRSYQYYVKAFSSIIDKFLELSNGKLVSK